MNTNKLKTYDLTSAQVGDKVLADPRDLGQVVYTSPTHVVFQWDKTTNIFSRNQEHYLFHKPLAWLGDDPVYKGDVIYSRHSSSKFVADRVSCGRLYAASGTYFSMDEGDKIQYPGLFSLTPVIKTIMVNGFEVPAPVQSAPEMGGTYYVADPLCDSCYVIWGWGWGGDTTDTRLLERGLIHTSQEAAVAHAKAMLCIDPEWRRP